MRAYRELRFSPVLGNQPMDRDESTLPAPVV
ncbi:hypothetical protein FBY39_1426 [Microbacterium sp. SLBN-146]|nr:hypothetical protein FBY39_1426 [Microbacterium sp. SLBN-146]